MFVLILLSCLFLAVLWSPAVKRLTSCLSCMLFSSGLCYFPICVLIHTRTNGAVGTVTTIFILTDRPRRCFFCGFFLLFMFHICPCYAVFSVRCSIVIPCWEKADFLTLLCVMFLVFLGVLGQVWYLIVLIIGICRLGPA